MAARTILDSLAVSPDAPLPLMSRRRVACFEELFLPIRLLNAWPRLGVLHGQGIL